MLSKLYQVSKGNVRSADGWKEVLTPVIARYKSRNMMRFFLADAAFAIGALALRDIVENEKRCESA